MSHFRKGDTVRRTVNVESFHNYLREYRYPQKDVYRVHSCEGVYLTLEGVCEEDDYFPSFISDYFGTVVSNPLNLKDWI